MVAVMLRRTFMTAQHFRREAVRAHGPAGDLIKEIII